jgi:hypothetical protein
MFRALSPLAAFVRFFARVVVGAVGAVLALAGLMLMLGFALFGVAVALVLVAWARLRGRPAPPVRFRWRQSWERRGRFSAGFGRRGRGASAPRREGVDEVVDVEFTERRKPDAGAPKRLE